MMLKILHAELTIGVCVRLNWWRRGSCVYRSRIEYRNIRWCTWRIHHISTMPFPHLTWAQTSPHIICAKSVLVWWKWRGTHRPIYFHKTQHKSWAWRRICLDTSVSAALSTNKSATQPWWHWACIAKKKYAFAVVCLMMSLAPPPLSFTITSRVTAPIYVTSLRIQLKWTQ